MNNYIAPGTWSEEINGILPYEQQLGTNNLGTPYDVNSVISSVHQNVTVDRDGFPGQVLELFGVILGFIESL